MATTSVVRGDAKDFYNIAVRSHEEGDVIQHRTKGCNKYYISGTHFTQPHSLRTGIVNTLH